MSPFTVSPAAAHELLPACRLLFSDGSAEHCRDRLLVDGEPINLFVARGNDGKLHAAALVQTLRGASGVSWAPRGDSPEAEDAVTTAACEWLRGRGVKVCQAFAPASEMASMAPLERAGFQHVTQLVFMRHEVDRQRDELRPEDWLDRTLYLPAFRDEFAKTLLATHENTLDCPELNGGRTDEEIVAGFDLPDRSTATAWHFLAKLDGQPVGLVMMNPGAETLELSYLGIVPAARGRGIGDKLMRLVLGAGCTIFKTITLSVDARNTPAMKLYARHGFFEYERREVWINSWSV